MHEGMAVAVRERRRQGGFPCSVAAVQDDEVMPIRPVSEAGLRHREPTMAASSLMVAKRPLMAYWIMRFRQFGSRPSANVHHPPGSAASTGRPVAAQAPMIRAAPGGVSGPEASMSVSPAFRDTAQSARAATEGSAASVSWNRVARWTSHPRARQQAGSVMPQVARQVGGWLDESPALAR